MHSYFLIRTYILGVMEVRHNPLVLQYDGSVGIGFETDYNSDANLTNGYRFAVNGNMHVKSIDIGYVKLV